MMMPSYKRVNCLNRKTTESEPCKEGNIIFTFNSAVDEEIRRINSSHLQRAGRPV